MAGHTCNWRGPNAVASSTYSTSDVTQIPGPWTLRCAGALHPRRVMKPITAFLQALDSSAGQSRSRGIWRAIKTRSRRLSFFSKKSRECGPSCSAGLGWGLGSEESVDIGLYLSWRAPIFGG